MSRRGLGEWVAGVVGDAIVVEKAAVVGKKTMFSEWRQLRYPFLISFKLPQQQHIM